MFRLPKRSPAEVEAVYKETVKKSRESIGKCITYDKEYVVESEEQSLIVIPVTLVSENKRVDTFALVDSGSSGPFVSADLVKKHQLPEITTEGVTYCLADSSVVLVLRLCS